VLCRSALISPYLREYQRSYRGPWGVLMRYTTRIATTVVLLGATSLTGSGTGIAGSPGLPTVSPQQMRADMQFRASLGFPASAEYVAQLDASPAAATSRAAYGAVFTAAEQRELDVRNALVAAAPDVDELLSTKYRDFAGIYLDPLDGTLHVGTLDGRDDVRAAVLAAVPDASRVVFFVASRAWSTLTALARRVTDDGTALAHAGVEVVSVTADPKQNRVSVGVDVSGASLADQATELVDLYGDGVVAEAAERPWSVSCLGCDTDSTPFKAGQDIYSGGSHCTAGFGVHTGDVISGKTWYQLTAGHCGGNGVTWDHYIYTLGTSAGHNVGGNNDSERLKLSSQSQHSYNMFVNGSYVPVSGYTTSFTNGQTVCTFGEATGFEQCGNIVSASTTVTYTLPGGGTATITDAVKMSYTYTGGDSGGPNFSQSSPATAMGLNTCTNSTNAWFTKIGRALSQQSTSLGATVFLNTQSNP
jgi:hypothetical protein